MALLGILPAAGYLVYGIFIRGDLGSQFSGRFIPALLLSPVNYLQWMTKASLAAGGIFIMLGLLGFFLVKDKRLRNFMFGLWGAYLLYGLFFDYHIATHDYYHLPLIPIVAVSLSSVGGLVLRAFNGVHHPSLSAKRSVCHPALWLILCRVECPQSDEGRGSSSRSHHVGRDR